MDTTRKRTLGDDFRDYLNGKIENKYNGGHRREYLGVQDTSAVAFGKLSNEDGLNHTGTVNPRKNEYEDYIDKTVKNSLATVPTREQYYSKIASEITVPTEKQFDKYQKDSKGITSLKYDNMTLEELQKEYDNLNAEYKNEYDAIMNSKDSDELKSEKVNTLNGNTKYDKLSEIKNKMRERKVLEENTKNTIYSKKYVNASTQDMQKALIHSSDTSEIDWLNVHQYDNATSEELETMSSKLSNEYNTLYNAGTNFEADKRREQIEKQQEKIGKVLRGRRFEEEKNNKYTKVIQNDVKAYTALQRYYALQSYKDTEKLLNDTGHDISSIKIKSTLDNYNYINSLNDEQKAQIEKDFNALSEKGYDTNALLKYYTREREEKKAEEQKEILQKYTRDNWAAGSAASVGLNLVGGVQDAVTYLAAVADEKINNGDGYINPAATNVEKAQIIRNEVSEMIGENISNETAAGIVQFLYNTGMSMADFGSVAALSVVPGGQAVGLTMLSTSAGVSAANEAIENGSDLDHAVLTGIAAGIAESMFEKVSLEQLKVFATNKDIRGAKEFFANIAKSAFTEGSEEVATDLANALSDQIINGDMSRLSTQYQNYINDGDSESEAWQKTFGNFVSQTLQDFAGGAISGGVLGAGAMGINYISTRDLRKDSADLGKIARDSEDFDLAGLVETAKSSSNAKAVKLAGSIEKLMNKEGEGAIKNVDIGNLLKLMNPEELTIENAPNNTQQEAEQTVEVQKSTENINNSVESVSSPEVETKSTAVKTVAPEEMYDFEKVPFGTKHINGLAATVNKTQKSRAVKRIVSSVGVYGKSDNNVTVEFEDGSTANADSVMFTESAYNIIADAAKEVDTYGARAMFNCWQSYIDNSNDGSVSEYVELFKKLYDVGRVGASLKAIENNRIYAPAINKLGSGAAHMAIEMGYRDSNSQLKSDSNKRVLVPNSDGSPSRVYADETAQLESISEQTRTLLNAIANKAGEDVVISNNIDGNGMHKDGVIYVKPLEEENTKYIVPVALHEAMHSISFRNPIAYKAIRDFVFNYLTAKGEDINIMIDEIERLYKDKVDGRDGAVEELVCNSVMALATDEKALRTALEMPDNRSLLQRVADALKMLVADIKNFIKGCTDNYAAQEWIDDVKALEQLAEKVSAALDESRKLRTKENSGVKYSIDPKFNEVYDNWGKKTGRFSFRIGSTSTVLQKLGIDNQNIWWDATKILKIKDKHPAMTDDVIKQVPNILEHPIIVMNSLTQKGRIVVFGEVYDSSGTPVLTALELNPIDKNGHSLNIIKIASAYGKDTDLQGLINKSDILYVEPNKKRTHNWLTVNRLQLPLPSSNYGFIKTIVSHSDNIVNNNSMQESEKKSEIKFAVDDIKRNIVQSEFENNVDAIEKNTYNSKNAVIMGVTPDILQKIGLTPLPLAMTKNHIYSIAVSETRAKKEGRYRKNTNYHNLGFNTVKDIYNKISNPLMVIAHPDFTNKENRDSTHKIIVFVDLSINNNQVIAPISIDCEGMYNNTHIDVNLVATYFDKNNINDLIKEAVALENNNQTGFFYIDKKRTQNIFKRAGYQLPRQLINSSSNIIIRKIDDNVNKKISNITQSQQFLRWFGDWQNHPEKASKVVDSEGNPLVVYHGTSNGGFTVFDTYGGNFGLFGIGSYFTENESIAQEYTDKGQGNNKHIYKVYLNIKNPLDMGQNANIEEWINNSGADPYYFAECKTNEDCFKALEEYCEDEGMYKSEAEELITEAIQSMGYDGITHIGGGRHKKSNDIKHRVWIAFEPEQIKSATDNIGTFDGNNPDIRYAVDDIKRNYEDKFDDLFTEDENGDVSINSNAVELAISQNPEITARRLLISNVEHISGWLQDNNNIHLSERQFQDIARKELQKFEVNLNSEDNKGIYKELALQLMLTTGYMSAKENNADEQFSRLADKCAECLQGAGPVDEVFENWKQGMRNSLRYKYLVLSERDYQSLLEEDITLRNLKQMLRPFQMYVRLENDTDTKLLPNNRITNVINILTDVENEGYGYLIDTDYEDDYYDSRIDDDLAAVQFVKVLSNLGKGGSIIANPYLEGQYNDSIESAATDMATAMLQNVINKQAEEIVKNHKAEKSEIKKAAKAKKDSLVEQNTRLRARNTALKSEFARITKAKNEKILSLRIKIDNYEKLAKSDRQKFRKQISSAKNEIEILERAVNSNMQPYKAAYREQYNEKRRRTELRRQLGKLLNSLTKRLDGKAKNNEYIPENLKLPMLKVLCAFADNFEVKQADGTVKPMPSYFGSFKNVDWNNIKKNIGANITELAGEYNNLAPKKVDSKNKTYAFTDTVTLSYDENVNVALNDLKEQLSGKNIYELSSADLKKLLDTMKVLDKKLKDAVQIIIDGKTMHIAEAAAEAIETVNAVNFKKNTDFKIGMVKLPADLFKEMRNQFLSSSLDPVRYGKFLSGYNEKSAMYQAMYGIHSGGKDVERIMQRVNIDIGTVTAKYSAKEIKNLQTKDVEQFEFIDINTKQRVKVSQGMLLSLYLTYQQADGKRHLVNEKADSYAVLNDLDNMNNIFYNAVGISNKMKSETRHKVKLTEWQMEDVCKYVENNKMLSEFANKISEILNGYLSDMIDEVSMEKYGRKLATIKNYFPMRVYKDSRRGDKEFEAVFSDTRMKSRGFTNQRSFSYSSLIIDDALSVFENHVNEVAEYCGLLIPIENFKKIYNVITENGTLHEAIEQKFGHTATHYIEKLMKDLQEQKDRIDENIFTRAAGNYMGAQLMLNPGAALKQLAAFPTAYKYFGALNVTKSAVMGIGLVKGKELCEFYSKYTPYMWYRAQGNGTIVGETSKQAGWYSKATDKLDVMGHMDRYVVNALLYAAEQHVSKTRKDLEFRSEEFCREVARQYEKCIDETQPNNMVTSKPQFIRNNVIRVLTLNAFKSQSMAMGNCVIDSAMEAAARINDYKIAKKLGGEAVENAKQARNTAVKNLLASCVGYITSSALLGLLNLGAKLLIWQRWDDAKDEKGEITFSSLSKLFLKNTADGILGAFIWGDTALEAIENWINKNNSYGTSYIDVMSVENINGIISDALNADCLSLITRIGDITGFPASNVMRILKSAVALGVNIANGKTIAVPSLTGEINTEFLPNYIVSAMQDGNKEQAEHYEQLMKESIVKQQNKTESEATDIIKNKIVTVLADYDDNIQAAALSYANGDYSNYKQNRDIVVNQGYDSADVKKAINKVLSDVKTDMVKQELADKEDNIAFLMEQGFTQAAAENLYNEAFSDDESKTESAFAETSESGNAYTYKDAFNALVNGDIENYEAIKEYMITEGGKDEDDFDSQMKTSSRTDPLWKEYISAVKSNDSAKVSTLKQQLTNIYGSWGKAITAMKKYQEKIKKKGEE